MSLAEPPLKGCYLPLCIYREVAKSCIMSNVRKQCHFLSFNQNYDAQSRSCHNTIIAGNGCTKAIETITIFVNVEVLRSSGLSESEG
jgi:hypothetical protein